MLLSDSSVRLFAGVRRRRKLHSKPLILTCTLLVSVHWLPVIRLLSQNLFSNSKNSVDRKRQLSIAFTFLKIVKVMRVAI